MKTTEVAVIGAGPAGMAAAIAAAETGAQTLLLDEQPAVGGHLRWTIGKITSINGATHEQRGVALANELRQHLVDTSVELWTNAVVWGLFENHVLAVLRDGIPERIKARAVVVATGTVDHVVPFPGWTTPGVMTARALQIFLHIHRVIPGQRFVIVGEGLDAEHVQEAVTLAGGEVVVTLPTADDLRVRGDAGVESVDVGSESFAADTVVLALGRRADPGLALQSLVSVGYDAATSSYVPLRDTQLQTSVAGLYVAGEAGGATTVAEALAEGRLAGLCAAGAPTRLVVEAQTILDRMRGAERPAWANYLSLHRAAS